MSIYWKIFTDAANQDKAIKVANSVATYLGASQSKLAVEQYHKGGFTCAFETPLKKDEWANVVLQTIALAQSIGRSYIINSSIQNELDMWSNDSSISGVTNIQVLVEKVHNKALQPTFGG